jgi:hypothetical protein
MMSHLIASLESGQDIGHYGRLTFAMVARPFLEPKEIVALLAKGADCDEDKARALVAQVEQRGYNPPKRERILEWMQKQEFPICPDSENPQACNVYRDLEFPREVYDRISSLYTEARNAT